MKFPWPGRAKQTTSEQDDLARHVFEVFRDCPEALRIFRYYCGADDTTLSKDSEFNSVLHARQIPYRQLCKDIRQGASLAGENKKHDILKEEIDDGRPDSGDPGRGFPVARTVLDPGD